MGCMQGREAILRVHARNKKMAPQADFKKVARATGGYTGAMLMNVMNTAAILAVRRGSPVVTTDDMFSVRRLLTPAVHQPCVSLE